jgi:colanic acid/amylovoran biosynthesis glycosyltransferase
LKLLGIRRLKHIEMQRVRITYLINEYPKVSHSFIRREILALEKLNVEVQRIALRGWDGVLVDAEDKVEQERTRYVLKDGFLPLFGAAIRAFLSNPKRFLSALALAIRIGWQADRALPYHFVYLAEACRIAPWLKSFGSRHIHAHFGTNAAEVALLTKALGAASYSITIHGPEEFDKPRFLHIEDKVRESAFIAAISSYARAQLFRCIEYAEWPKVSVVRCGIETQFHDVAQVAPPEVARVVCVGRICNSKGQMLLVESAKRVADKGIGFELVFAGDGEMREDVEALVSRYGLGNRVRITGWISANQVREEILASRGLVLASFAEGLPVVIMEAMALRRPVLSTYVAGIPELVQPPKTGWLVSAGSVDELTEALADFLTRPVSELRAMGEAAYHRVIALHSVEKEAAKLLPLFRKTITSSAKP